MKVKLNLTPTFVDSLRTWISEQFGPVTLLIDAETESSPELIRIRTATGNTVILWIGEHESKA